ncbi:hypothetical protein QYE76_054479 [Lolium multiflorum]|uniref:Aminotransferase-like plant mobile domain-containing protein n=1 Tax=Lolium multiflorum TaxID=4521 RepID=A0AAD8SYQ5_LOLMU|nr:hypothetical protein QYE76_054479 [Lolium multiflorum]
MNAAALTALVDRWRPETHTFHLRAGEMAPTLQDVSMILGLPIQGEPLCMNTASDGWHEQMAALIGMAPPLPAEPKARAPAGASFSWIRTNFGECPEGANEDTIRTYTRVYLWYMISRTLFPDSGGKLAHWCWLKALTVLEHRGVGEQRHLPTSTGRTGSRTGSGGIGGCMLLLSVWSWDRLSVGRPRTLTERPWPHHHENLDREPTWAYLWDNVSEMTSDPKIMYRQYTAELDTLTAEQVEWEPYGSYYHIGAGMTDLNHKCTEEARFWRMRCPLICMWLVEHHQPHRVMRQFGLYQECPPQWQDTDKALHRLDRQRQRKITNWPVHHSGHVAAFLHCLEATRNAGPEEIVPHDLATFNNYLQWFHENTRIELVKHAYAEDILDDPIEFDEVAQSQHDTFARRGRSTSIASELNFVRTEIQKTAHECEIMWEQSGRDEKPVGPLRHFIKIPENGEILSQSIPPSKKQAPRSAYQLKPRGKAPNRYTPEDYVNRGKKVVIEEDEGPPRRSSLSRMRNDEPLSSEEEEQEEQQQQEPRQRTKRMGVRKQPRSLESKENYKVVQSSPIIIFVASTSRRLNPPPHLHTKLGLEAPRTAGKSTLGTRAPPSCTTSDDESLVNITRLQTPTAGAATSPPARGKRDPQLHRTTDAKDGGYAMELHRNTRAKERSAVPKRLTDATTASPRRQQVHTPLPTLCADPPISHPPATRAPEVEESAGSTPARWERKRGSENRLITVGGDKKRGPNALS